MSRADFVAGRIGEGKRGRRAKMSGGGEGEKAKHPHSSREKRIYHRSPQQGEGERREEGAVM